jgi:RNase P/RNase MRP subunit p29
MAGQTVRVTLVNGNKVEGRMGGIVDERMEVVRLVDGGEVAYPIAMRLIDTFEVWRRDQNP